MDRGFSNLLEVVGTCRPNLHSFAIVEGDDISERTSRDEETHYRRINGKFGIYAEL